MKKVYSFELANLMGGVVQPVIDYCTSLQNEANAEGNTWTNEEWEKWIDKWMANCTH